MAKTGNPLFKRTGATRQADDIIYDDPDFGQPALDPSLTNSLLTELPPGCSLEPPLTAAEKKRLAQLEDFVSNNFQTFYDVGCALREICDHRLYRETHTNFADYSKDLWDLARSRAYQMIEAANVVDNIKKIADEENVQNFGQSNNSQEIQLVIPQNDSQARTLAKYPPDKQREIWSEAINTIGDGRISATHIRKTASTLGLKKVKKAVKKARKKPNRGPKMSPGFEKAYYGFLDAINQEREAEWKNTDKKPAIQAVRVILQALEAEL